MTRGTIFLIGPGRREIDLFRRRLEKENFTVVACPAPAHITRAMRQAQPQAVLIRDKTPRTQIEAVVGKFHNAPKTRHMPCIIIADDTLPSGLKKMPGIGEALRLHEISLAEALRRLRLAIRLSQLAR